MAVTNLMVGGGNLWMMCSGASAGTGRVQHGIRRGNGAVAARLVRRRPRDGRTRTGGGAAVRRRPAANVRNGHAGAALRSVPLVPGPTGLDAGVVFPGHPPAADATGRPDERPGGWSSSVSLQIFKKNRLVLDGFAISKRVKRDASRPLCSIGIDRTFSSWWLKKFDLLAIAFTKKFPSDLWPVYLCWTVKRNITRPLYILFSSLQ